MLRTQQKKLKWWQHRSLGGGGRERRKTGSFASQQTSGTPPQRDTMNQTQALLQMPVQSAWERGGIPEHGGNSGFPHIPRGAHLPASLQPFPRESFSTSHFIAASGLPSPVVCSSCPEFALFKRSLFFPVSMLASPPPPHSACVMIFIVKQELRIIIIIIVIIIYSVNKLEWLPWGQTKRGFQ